MNKRKDSNREKRIREMLNKKILINTTIKLKI